jgi:DNA repair protein RecO (recombination protein O)
VLYRDEGIVLRTYKLGEADRIVVLMTAGRGKVRAVAKGIRRTKSRIGGRLEPPSRVSLLVYEGRELDVISQAETLDHYPILREELERLTDALSIVEAVDQVAQEGEANGALYRMLAGALRTLAGAEVRSPLLVAAFYWKLLGIEGVAPVLDSCLQCGAADVVSFDPVEGGVLCREHRRGSPIEGATIDVVRRILGGDLAAVLQEPTSVTASAASALATTSLEAHLERRLRAVHLLGHTTA